VHAAIRGIVLNDVKAEVSPYASEMQYLYQRYDRRPPASPAGEPDAPPRAAAAGER
jgi:hypothetical protein